MFLANTRVLDLTRLLPGPFATSILADLGADVVHIDRPGETYDVVEMMGAARGVDPARIRAFDNLGRNKRSIVLDLKSETGREVFQDLVKQADIVLEGFRPGVARALGVDYASVSGWNPRVVYGSLSSYGQEGPYRDIPAHDANAMAISGLLALPGNDEGHPVHPGANVGDIASGMYMAIAVLAALLSRASTGKGTLIDIAMSDAAMSWLPQHASIYWMTGELLVPHPGARKLDVVYAADNKPLLVVSGEPRLWLALCETLGLDGIKDANLHDPIEHQKAISLIQATIATKPRAEWWQAFQTSGACVSPLYDIPEALADAHAIARGMVMETEHELFGTVRQLGSPIKADGVDARVRNFSPAPGDDRDDVLRGLGWTTERIAEAERRGAFGPIRNDGQPGEELV